MIGRPTDYSPVALDDLGLEQQTDYTVEQMTMILGTMYRAVIPLSITTNAVSKTNDICIQRIWDRILKRCPHRRHGRKPPQGKGAEELQPGQRDPRDLIPLQTETANWCTPKRGKPIETSLSLC